MHSFPFYSAKEGENSSKIRSRGWCFLGWEIMSLFGMWPIIFSPLHSQQHNTSVSQCIFSPSFFVVDDVDRQSWKIKEWNGTIKDTCTPGQIDEGMSKFHSIPKCFLFWNFYCWCLSSSRLQTCVCTSYVCQDDYWRYPKNGTCT